MNGYAITVWKITRQREGTLNEVTVYFNNVADRDEVKTAARNLRPGDECGVNIEVYHHLRGNFRALQNLAYRLKQKGQLKRNVTYNDETMDLEMSFSLNSGPWKTVLPGEARAAATVTDQRQNSVTYADLNEMLAAPDNNEDSDVEIDEVVPNTRERSYPVLSLFNANARSLGPKITSLIVAIKELGLNGDCF